MDILDFATERNGSSLEKIHDLHTQLAINVLDIDTITDNIIKITLVTPDDFDTLEDLYHKEFMLYMDNASICEDLFKYLEAEPRTSENEFELARIQRDAEHMDLVEYVDL